MVGAGALEIGSKNLKKWSKIVFILLEQHEFSNDGFHVCPWNKKINRLKKLKSRRPGQDWQYNKFNMKYLKCAKKYGKNIGFLIYRQYNLCKIISDFWNVSIKWSH